MVGGWYTFLASNSVETIWPMFGVSNQLLAVMALAVGTTALVRSGKGRYAWVTLVPMMFVAITTITASVMLTITFVGKMNAPKADPFVPLLNISLIAGIVLCTAMVVGGALLRITRLERIAVPERQGVLI